MTVLWNPGKMHNFEVFRFPIRGPVFLTETFGLCSLRFLCSSVSGRQLGRFRECAASIWGAFFTTEAHISCNCDPGRDYGCPLCRFLASIWLLPSTPGRFAFAPRVLGGPALEHAGHWRWSPPSRPPAHYGQTAVSWLFYFLFAFLFFSLFHLSPRWLFRRAKSYSKFMPLLKRLKAPWSVHDTEYWLCEVRKWHSTKGRKAFEPRPLKQRDRKRIRRMLFLQSLLGCIFSPCSSSAYLF